jgi:hypothetical protein
MARRFNPLGPYRTDGEVMLLREDCGSFTLSRHGNGESATRRAVDDPRFLENGFDASAVTKSQSSRRHRHFRGFAETWH